MKSLSKFVSAAVLGLCAVGSAQAVVSTAQASNWALQPGDFGATLDGVAKLLYSNASGNFVCSGSLLAGGQYVLTAAHCAADFTSMTADFRLGSVTAKVVGATLHEGWNGALGTGADIALVKLDRAITGIEGFTLSSTNDVGRDILMAGYGLTGNGLTGATAFDFDPASPWNTWRPHFGFNTIDLTDFDLKEGVFGAGSGNKLFGETYVYDFDDGSAAHNALNRLRDDRGVTWRDSSAGLGIGEALIAGGDSGGGDFYWSGSQWILTGVHSYTWGLCGYLPDCDVAVDAVSSFGDLSGSTAVFTHKDWIDRVMAVPEPQTWALMLVGLAAVGGSARRRALTMS